MNSYPWDYSEGDGDYSPRATVVQVESLGKGAWALLTVAMILGALGLLMGGMAWQMARLAEREARVAQDKTQYLQSAMDRSGLKVDNDH